MKRVAVLRGGPSEEYSVSMQTGSGVLAALEALGYEHKDITITKSGQWLEQGFIKTPDQTLEAVDAVFLALHGTYGEDGKIQRMLERKNIPFTGSRSLSSGIAFNKELTKHTLRPHGIKMPKHRRVSRSELPQLREEIPLIFADLGTELFVKPIANGSSLGAQYAPTEDSLYAALSELLTQYEDVLVEEFIRGKEATVGVLDNYRNQSTYVLPVVEIIPPNGMPLFSHADKYNEQTQKIVPGRFSYLEKVQLSEIAELVHRTIDCKHYSRSDFIVKDGDVYFLEVNTLPGLTSESLFPKAAQAVGLEYNQLIEHLIENAN